MYPSNAVTSLTKLSPFTCPKKQPCADMLMCTPTNPVNEWPKRPLQARQTSTSSGPAKFTGDIAEQQDAAEQSCCQHGGRCSVQQATSSRTCMPLLNIQRPP